MSMAIIGSSGALGEFPSLGTSRYPPLSNFTSMPRMAYLRPVNEDSNKINEPDVESPLVENSENVEQVCLILISFIFVWLGGVHFSALRFFGFSLLVTITEYGVTISD